MAIYAVQFLLALGATALFIWAVVWPCLNAVLRWWDISYPARSRLVLAPARTGATKLVIDLRPDSILSCLPASRAPPGASMGPDDHTIWTNLTN